MKIWQCCYFPAPQLTYPSWIHHHGRNQPRLEFCNLWSSFQGSYTTFTMHSFTPSVRTKVTELCGLQTGAWKIMSYLQVANCTLSILSKPGSCPNTWSNRLLWASLLCRPCNLVEPPPSLFKSMQEGPGIFESSYSRPSRSLRNFTTDDAETIWILQPKT